MNTLTKLRYRSIIMGLRCLELILSLLIVLTPALVFIGICLLIGKMKVHQ